MDNLIKIFLIMIICTYSTYAFAVTDPWYENNPSCVINGGNPGRTGEYIAVPIFKKPKAIWGETSISNGGLICFDNFIFSWRPGKRSMTTGEYFETPNLSQTVAYKSKFYGAKDGLKGNTLVSFMPNTNKTESLFFTEPVYFAPLVYNDTVFIPGTNFVYAYSLQSSKLLWKLKTSELSSSSGQNSPLSTDGERIYLSNWDRKLYALDIHTGKPVWILDGISAFYAPIIVKDDFLYVSDNAKVYAIMAKTGEIIWKKPFPENSAALAVNKNIVIASGSNGYIYALKRLDGQKLWAAKCKTITAPVIVDPILYSICGGNSLTALSLKNGKKLWKAEIPRQGDRYPGSQIMPYKDKLFVAGTHQNLAAFEAIQ